MAILVNWATGATKFDTEEREPKTLVAKGEPSKENLGESEKMRCISKSRGPPKDIIHYFTLMFSKLTLFYIIFENWTFYISV